MDQKKVDTVCEMNPFLSEEFLRVWSKYFNSSGRIYECAFVEVIKFIRRKPLPIYENVGSRMTQGLAYTLKSSLPKRVTNRVCLIYDVPSYLELNRPPSSRVGLKKIEQYQAYAIKLDGYRDVNEYLKDRFNSRARWQLRRALKRFETCYEVSVQVRFGPGLDRNEYDALFDLFRSLLLKRYEFKKEEHPFLSEDNWNYLHELVFKLINDQKALLLIVYADNVPVAINLCYVYGDTVTLALPSFDINFGKFKVGHLSTLYTIRWCLQNAMRTYDFSKGHYAYKERWSNRKYSFDYHIIYDKKSLVGTMIAHMMASFFKTKNKMRNLDLDSKFHDLKYKLKYSQKTALASEYKISEVPEPDALLSYPQIEGIPHQADFLKSAVNDFLFKYSEKRKDTSIHQIDDRRFYLKGSKAIVQVGIMDPRN